MGCMSKTIWTCDSCLKGCMGLFLDPPGDSWCPRGVKNTEWTAVPDLPKDDRDDADRPYDQSTLEDFAES